MSVYTGSCLCGSVTYEAEGEPRRVFECYCNWCQKITGGSARAYAVFDMGKVNYSGGAISEFVDKNTEHGFKMINRFCSNCGSPVEMHVERVPDGQFVISALSIKSVRVADFIVSFSSLTFSSEARTFITEIQTADLGT